jgi:hypothetical protein
VNEETEKKSAKLRNSSEAETGMEILHYFILDLLGRSFSLCLHLSVSLSLSLADVIQGHSCGSHLLDQD